MRIQAQQTPVKVNHRGRCHRVRLHRHRDVQGKEVGTFGESTEVFGLYELSDRGMILYSRSRGSSGLNWPTTDAVGRDFFSDYVGCDNREDLRRHFQRFIAGSRPVDHFIFDCMFEREIVRTKVSMTRAFETDEDRANEIVIVDIRQIGE